jgi:4-amino-4-deoxychorismate lyase
MLINGAPGDKLDIHDRGLMYGDGVFRTLCIRGGQPQNWARHYRKLYHDCAALDLPCPEAELLVAELRQLSALQADGVAKIIVTRGRSERGYAPPSPVSTTRILSLAGIPDFPDNYRSQGISLRLCDLRLSHQPRLAGVKHLNRLENVMAAAEWNDPGIAEGLLLDMTGNVIEGTRSNVFLVHNGGLRTPDLSRCGVAGVQRERIMEWAARQHVPCTVGELSIDDVLAADEVFLVNSVIGLWPVHRLLERSWNCFPLSQRIGDWLDDETTD